MHDLSGLLEVVPGPLVQKLGQEGIASIMRINAELAAKAK
jgi:hypothetical protein